MNPDFLRALATSRIADLQRAARPSRRALTPDDLSFRRLRRRAGPVKAAPAVSRQFRPA